MEITINIDKAAISDFVSPEPDEVKNEYFSSRDRVTNLANKLTHSGYWCAYKHSSQLKSCYAGQRIIQHIQSEIDEVSEITGSKEPPKELKITIINKSEVNDDIIFNILRHTVKLRSTWEWPKRWQGIGTIKKKVKTELAKYKRVQDINVDRIFCESMIVSFDPAIYATGDIAKPGTKVKMIGSMYVLDPYGHDVEHIRKVEIDLDEKEIYVISKNERVKKIEAANKDEFIEQAQEALGKA